MQLLKSLYKKKRLLNRSPKLLQKSIHERKPSTDIHTYWTVKVYGVDGKLKRTLCENFHNVFPSGCVDVIHQNSFTNTSISGSGFNFIGLTADTTQTINAAQTTLTGEITTNGLIRIQAVTRTHSAGASTSLIEHTFTLTGTQTDITRAALFNAVTTGVMGPFAAFSNGATGQMVSGETVKVSITITTS
jgi:hypothetical protein